MTLATTSNKVTYAGNSATTSFSFSFPIPSAPYLQVVYVDASGNQTTLFPFQYQVTGIGSDNGGTVVYPLSGSPIASGTSLTISRIVPYNQNTSLVNQSGYYPNVVEDALDYLTMQTQQLSEQFSRALQFPITDISPLSTLPSAAARKNQALIFDSNGNATTGSPSTTTISSPMIPVVNAASTAIALFNLLGLSEWIPQAAQFWSTPTYISATSFSVNLDKTAIFTAQRRLQAIVTAGVITGTIRSASFGGGITTVIVNWDSTQLDSGLSAVSVGLLESVPVSVPYIFPFSKMRSLEYYGAKANAGFDNHSYIQDAIDNTGTFNFECIGTGSPYETTGVFTVNRPAIRAYSETKGLISAYSPVIKYTGVATGEPLIFVNNGMHGFCLDSVNLDCNSLARTALHIYVADLDSNHYPSIRNVLIKGYNSRGIILGKDSTSVIGTGQLSMVDMERVWLLGGDATAIGILLNAQNCEQVCAKGLYFAPINNHSHHIFEYAGGMDINGLQTTNSSDYAILCRDQVTIKNWRAEDRYLLQVPAVGLGGPVIVDGFLGRSTSAIPGDLAIDFGASGTSMIRLFGKTKGSVNIGNSAPLGIQADVLFDGGGDFILPGPQQWFGYCRNLATGRVYERGNREMANSLTVDGDFNSVGNLSTTGYFNLGPAVNNITAHAGGGQTNAVSLTALRSRVTVVGTAGDSVKFSAAATNTGDVRFVRNVTATSLNLFPISGDAFNGLAANTAIAIPGGMGVIATDDAVGVWSVYLTN